MKKIYLLVLVVAVSLRLNAQVIRIIEQIDQYTSNVVETYVNTENAKYEVRISDNSPIKGVTGGHSWVQLWAGGPRFAKFNVGSKITDYDQAPKVAWEGKVSWGDAPWTVQVCGPHFGFGGIIPDDHDTQIALLSGGNDASIALWGHDWRMPEQSEWTAMVNNCDLKWIDGKEGNQIVPGCTLSGFKVSGKADTRYENNYIFLPATGLGAEQVGGTGIVVGNIGDETRYWANSFYDGYRAYTPYFKEYWHEDGTYFDISIHEWVWLNQSPQWSCPIRAILNRGNSGPTIKILKNGQEIATYLSSKYTVKFEEGPVTKGVTGGHSWVQLWAGGPRFAEYNVGSRITTYKNATEYNVANIGCKYVWGGFCNGQGNYKADNSDLTESEDLVRSTWNSNWRMPTQSELLKLYNRKNQFDELMPHITSWELIDGVNKQYEEGCTIKGWKVSGVGEYAGNSIFLPCVDDEKNGAYWSNTWASLGDHDHAWALKLYEGTTPSVRDLARYDCYSIRAVLAD